MRCIYVYENIANFLSCQRIVGMASMEMFGWLDDFKLIIIPPYGILSDMYQNEQNIQE